MRILQHMASINFINVHRNTVEYYLVRTSSYKFSIIIDNLTPQVIGISYSLLRWSIEFDITEIKFEKYLQKMKPMFVTVNIFQIFGNFVASLSIYCLIRDPSVNDLKQNEYIMLGG